MGKFFVRNDFQKIKRLICLHIAFLLGFILFYGFGIFCFFKAGYTAAIEDSPYFDIIFFAAFALPLLFFICLVINGVVLVKIGIRYIFCSLVFWLLSFLICYLIGCCLSFFWGFPAARGYYCYVRDNVEIDELQKWLTEYEHKITRQEEYGEEYRTDLIFEENWPVCIKQLNPKEVTLYGEKPQKYIRIIHGLVAGPSFGLCVMEEPLDIPLDVYYDSEYRIKLSDNAFIWHQIK
ncbi:MAG: hypothetical protein ACYS8Z_10035 [Planctomycetota bacterium]|jgi:hypothetical protein